MRKGVLVAALALAVAVVGTAVAAFPQDNVKLYTGCLNSGGNITYVKEGDSPLQACASPKQVVKLSGGDITSVNTPAGSGLSGGSTNGAVTLTLDAAHSLPSGCTSGQVVKSSGSDTWTCADDNDHTYTAYETTLNLSGNTFSIASDYRVKNNPDCDSGKFATGFDSSGTIQCTAPGANVIETFEVAPADRGITDNGRTAVAFIVKPTAGKYFVAAKGVITSENNVDDNSSVTCFLHTRDANGVGSGFFSDVVGLSSDTLNAVDDVPIALDALMNVATGDSIYFECDADNGADGVGMRVPVIVAVKVG
jgi:hypothetical protein